MNQYDPVEKYKRKCKNCAYHKFCKEKTKKGLKAENCDKWECAYD